VEVVATKAREAVVMERVAAEKVRGEEEDWEMAPTAVAELRVEGTGVLEEMGGQAAAARARAAKEVGRATVG